MYYYKRQNGETQLIDYQPSNDLYDVEEHIMKLLRKEKNKRCQEICDIDTKFVGNYTIYDFGCNFVFLTSEYVLKADSTIDTNISKDTIVRPPEKKKRKRRTAKPKTITQEAQETQETEKEKNVNNSTGNE